jgi:excisionase family DNA binding protein
MPSKILFTFQEAARALGVREEDVNRLVADGELCAVWICGAGRLEPAELRRYVEACRESEDRILSRKTWAAYVKTLSSKRRRKGKR